MVNVPISVGTGGQAVHIGYVRGSPVIAGAPLMAMAGRGMKGVSITAVWMRTFQGRICQPWSDTVVSWRVIKELAARQTTFVPVIEFLHTRSSLPLPS